MFKKIRSNCARTLAVWVWFTCAVACNLVIAQTNSSPPGLTPSWVAPQQKKSPSSTQPAGDTANRTAPLAAVPSSARILSQNASTGERRDYYDTSLTACPSGEQLIYFWYYQDIPELRGQSWCGAAQADLDYANATDPYRWRIPYLMDSCQAGVNWRYSHAFQDGTRYHSPPYREINLACRVEDLPPEPTPTPEAPQGCQAGAYTENPIIPATGEKIKDEIDYKDSSTHELNFVRHYRGNRIAAGAFSRTWSHDYATNLKVLSAAATINFGDGRVRSFTNPNGTVLGTSLTPWPSITGQGSLVPLSLAPGAPYSGWQYINPEDDSVWVFDALGKALSQSQRNGWAVSYAFNAADQLERVTNAFGSSLVFAYNSAGQLSSVTTPDNRVINYGYDSAARLVSASYPNGSSKSYLYENTAYPQALTGIVDEAGQRTTYEYDSQGRATSSALAGGLDRYQVNYGQANQSVVIDPLGTQRSYGYATQNGKLAVTVADKPSGTGEPDAASRLQDTNGLITQEIDFLGVQTMFTWDITRRLPLQTTRAAGQPEAQTSTTQWHPTFRLPVLVTEAGKTTAYSYDTLGNKTSETQTDTATGQARTWAWAYNTQGLVATATDPMGRISSYTYDSAGNRTAMHNPLGHETTYSFDAAGRPTQAVAPNGLTTTYAYGLRGRLLSAITGNEATTYTYNPTGQLASARLPSGYQASYAYDAAQRLTGATDNRGNTIAYTLDAMGNRVREEVKDPSGAIALVTSTVINSLNRVAAVQGASGQSTALAYDANGEATSSTDPLNQTTRQTLDALKRPVATTFADNAQAQQSYNQLDQLTQARDPKGIATSYSRNAWGEVMAEASPDIGSITYQRNAAGEVVSQQDAKGNITQITRDALGRPLQVRHSPTKISYYSWDSGSTGSQTGYLAKLEDASGTTLYERDSFGRILSKLQTVNDNPANPSQLKTAYTYGGGQLASISYPSGLKVSYKRSTSGQIIGIDTQEPFTNPRRPSPVTPFVSGLSYTALGQPKAWSWASGDTASRQFDQDGRMSANEFAAYTFDAASRITGITQNLWASRTVTQVIGTGTAVVTQLYQTPLSWQAGYDNRNRLISFTRAGVETRYSYDANSNRLSSLDKTTNDTDLDGSFDLDDFSQSSFQTLNVEGSSNKLLGFSQTLTKVKGTKTQAITTSNVSYSLDANGNLTGDGLRTFDYDEANRLAKVIASKDGEAAAISYLHNAFGQRVFKSEPKADSYQPNEQELGTDFITWLKKNFQWLFTQAQTDASIGTSFTFGDEQMPEWAVLGEYDNGSAKGKGRTEYIWLPTEDQSAIPVGLYRNGKFFAVHTDHLGTPRLMTNEQNAPVWQWPYSAFGNNKPTGVLKATPNPRAAITNSPVLLRATAATELNLRMPGQYADEEAGQFYNYYRNYQPSQGRYSQSDPIGLAGGSNRFAYVEGNPLMYTDPEGLRPPGFGSPFGRPLYRPSTRDMARNPSLPSRSPSMDANNAARDLFNTVGNMPTALETNLPGAWPGINYIPPITQSIVLPPRGPNGCTVTRRPAPNNQCPAAPPIEVYCGPSLSAR